MGIIWGLPHNNSLQRTSGLCPLAAELMIRSAALGESAMKQSSMAQPPAVHRLIAVLWAVVAAVALVIELLVVVPMQAGELVWAFREFAHEITLGVTLSVVYALSVSCAIARSRRPVLLAPVAWAVGSVGTSAVMLMAAVLRAGQWPEGKGALLLLELAASAALLVAVPALLSGVGLGITVRALEGKRVAAS